MPSKNTKKKMKELARQQNANKQKELIKNEVAEEKVVLENSNAQEGVSEAQNMREEESVQTQNAEKKQEIVEKDSNNENSQKEDNKKLAKNVKAKKEKKRGIGSLFSNLKGELKRVSWPTFSQVAKKTGIVIAVTLIFAVVLLGLDSVLRIVHDLLI